MHSGPAGHSPLPDLPWQGELAKHTQRAASRIELQGKEVEMLKSRIRWASLRHGMGQDLLL